LGIRERADKTVTSTVLAQHKVDLSSHIVKFKGSLDYSSKFCGDQDREVDARWERLNLSRSLNYTRLMTRTDESLYESKVYAIDASVKDLRDAKLDLDQAKYPDKLGGGYLVWLEATHQLHYLVRI
jgi:Mycotoxin biosynthesis protein UstYa